MSRIKLLLDVVNCMRSLADSIEVMAQAMADGDHAQKAEKQALKAEAEKSIKSKEIAPAVTHEMLRETAVKLSRNGKRTEVKTLLNSYGVANITAVAESDIEAFYADLTALEVVEDAAD